MSKKSVIVIPESYIHMQAFPWYVYTLVTMDS
jgi:hypothetical protein